MEKKHKRKGNRENEVFCGERKKSSFAEVLKDIFTQRV